MADQNLLYYALLFGAVLAYPLFRLVAKQLGQFAGTPGQGKDIAGGGYGGKTETFTRADVAKHGAQDDLWVVIRGKVYDLSEYVDEHPGGVAAIMVRLLPFPPLPRGFQGNVH